VKIRAAAHSAHHGVIANAREDDKSVRAFGTEAMNVVITVHWQTRHFPALEQFGNPPGANGDGSKESADR